jgi:riboflavin biosynthesis pyrimidine reductase
MTPLFVALTQAAVTLRVDECHLFVAPIVVGGGTQALPTGVRLTLDLLDERRFRSGMVHLHYRLRT